MRDQDGEIFIHFRDEIRRVSRANGNRGPTRRFNSSGGRNQSRSFLTLAVNISDNRNRTRPEIARPPYEYE